MTPPNDRAPTDPKIPSRRAADAASPNKPASQFTGDGEQPPERPPEQERRRGNDRRQRDADRDHSGQINSGSYTGPDRRTGLDRRAYMERQRKAIVAEKMRFVHRSMLTFGVFFFLIVVAAVFLLAPEYAWLKHRAEEIAPQELLAKQEKQQPAVPLGLAMNRQIEKVENVGAGLSATTQAMIARAGEAGQVAAATAHQLAAGNSSGLRELVDFIGNTRQMSMSAQGSAQLDGAVDNLKRHLGGWRGDAAGFSSAVQSARGKDPVLDSMLGSVSAQDMEAAAMLLLMGEFRSNLSTGRSFDQDLAVVRQLAGNDPKLQQSLARLAPYAKEGVLNRDGLQKEFKGLAMDIVNAKIAGQPANVQERAQQRLNDLVKVRKVDTVEGASTDAVVNRAQALLDRGDINGAVRELQALQGPSADAAAPFIAQAQGTIAAQQSSDMLMNAVLGQLAAGGGVSLDGLKGLVTNSLGFDQPVSPVSGK